MLRRFEESNRTSSQALSYLEFFAKVSNVPCSVRMGFFPLRGMLKGFEVWLVRATQPRYPGLPS